MNQVSDQPLVLVADDAPEFRETTIPDALRRLNAIVLKAKDVREACLLAAEHDAHSEDPLDLIVLDMHMPLHEGVTTPAEDAGIQFLRSHELTECPVIVFTAYPSHRDCVRAVQAGAAAYLPKKRQDAYGGPEGGVDQLVATCRQLLAKPQAEETHVPPDARWLEDNYAWLCGQFGDRFVAFVPAQEAKLAGINGMEREGLSVVGGESKRELVRLIAGKLPLLKAIPPIVFVPRPESEHDTALKET
jgi:CheY-like chemotaxis protein